MPTLISPHQRRNRAARLTVITPNAPPVSSAGIQNPSGADRAKGLNAATIAAAINAMRSDRTLAPRLAARKPAAIPESAMMPSTTLSFVPETPAPRINSTKANCAKIRKYP